MITRDDIMPTAEFSKIRRVKRQELLAIKKNRRVPVGPDATFYFENYDTMWFQIHEMLFIEQGGAEQIDSELEAYNPMIPNGSELVATLMFEIEKAKKEGDAEKKKIAMEAEKYLEELDVGGGDLDRNRSEMIRYILKLGRSVESLGEN